MSDRALYRRISADVAADRRAGMTMRELAKKYGCAPSTIREALQHVGFISSRVPMTRDEKRLAQAARHEDLATKAFDEAAQLIEVGNAHMRLARLLMGRDALGAQDS